MKRIIVGILLVFQVPILGFSQAGIDASHTTIGLDLFVNRCFEDLDSINILEESPITKGIPFCNVASCLGTLEYFNQDSKVNQAIFSRLEELSERLYDEGTPIVLTRGCFSDDQLLNENRNGWLEVCVGNSCLVYGNLVEGINKFNEKTKSLVVK